MAVPKSISAFAAAALMGAALLHADEPYWLAARYRGSEVVVYFDAVKFGNLVPVQQNRNAQLKGMFLTPMLLPADFIKRFQKAERFSEGDSYDLLSGGDKVADLTLEKLVAAVGDEGPAGHGNDSYIGALAAVKDGLKSSADYYVVTRHQEHMSGSLARLIEKPIPAKLKQQLADLIIRRMQATAPKEVGLKASKTAPLVRVQAFQIADGSVRYYCRVVWNGVVEDRSGFNDYALAGWLTTRPTLSLLATENQTSTYGFDAEMPQLLNVVDLGDGRTGLIILISGEDSLAFHLLEFSDGKPTRLMRVLQKLEAAE